MSIALDEAVTGVVAVTEEVLEPVMMDVAVLVVVAALFPAVCAIKVDVVCRAVGLIVATFDGASVELVAGNDIKFGNMSDMC